MMVLALTGLPSKAYMSGEANLFYQQACTLEYQHNYEAAAEKVLQAIQLTGDDAMLYTKLAGLYTELGKYEEALSAYQKVSKLRPNDAFIFISIGNIYQTKGDYKESLAAYESALKIFPEYKYNYLNIANVQYQLGEYKSGVDNYQKFLSAYPQHKEARENLANSYFAAGDSQNAVNQYALIYEKDVTGFKYFANYGLALFKLENYGKAVEMLEKAVEIDAENTSAHVSLALAYQEIGKNDLSLAQYQVVFTQEPKLHSLRLDYANLLAEMSKNAEAIEQYKIYTENFPDDVRGLKNLAILYQREKNYDSAIASYEKAILKDSEDLTLKKELANCYHAKKDYQNALKYYDAVLAADSKDLQVKTNKAIVLHALNRYEDAIALYEQILNWNDSEIVKDNLMNALIAQGNIDLKVSNYTKATEHFDKAVSLGTKDSEAYFGLARAYRACKLNDKAAEYYEEAINMSPDKQIYSEEYAEFIASTQNHNVQSTVVVSENMELPAVSIVDDESAEQAALDKERNKDLILIADESYKKKSYDDAIRNYQAALKINPSDEVTLLKIGNTYKIQNDNEKAIDFYKKSIFVNPSYADGWFNLGLVYASNNDINGSKECFNRVLSINPKYAYAYYALAVANETEKNNAEAVKNYRLFLENNTDERQVAPVLDKIKSLE